MAGRARKTARKARGGARRVHRGYARARKAKRKLTRPARPFRFHV